MDAAETSQSAPSGDKPFVFVSYARGDRPAAVRIIGMLEDAGFPVWWDDLIDGGERFGPRIGEALDTARAVMVLWSKASVESHWVKDEATRGIERGCLVPVTIDGSEPPLGFRQFHCIDLSRGAIGGNGPDAQMLFRALGSLFGRAANPVPVRTPPRRAIGRRTMLASGAGAALALGGFGLWRHFGTSRPSANTLAVLPFQNIGGDPARQYFSDGLAAELRAQLSRNPLLSVMGQASSEEFREAKASGRAIATKLGVAYLLDGNVRVAGDVVRIAVELIEGISGFSKWSNSYERPLNNILQIQQEIAEAISVALAVKLSGPAAQTRRESGGTDNPAAFDAFLRGKTLFESQKDEDSDRGALARFGAAIALDGRYAAARAARARTLAAIGNQYVQGAERRAIYAESIAEAERAIRDAPEFADGYAALGYGLFYGQLDVLAANAPYEKAYLYGQGNPDVLSRYALYQARRRQFARSYPAMARAQALDPLNPSIFKTDGLIRFANGDFEGAIVAARRALEINPERGTLHGDIGNALLMLNRIAEAEAAFVREKVGLLSIPGRAFVAQRRGDRAGVTRALQELVTEFGDNGLYQQAQVLAQAGRPGEAIAALEHARAMQDSGLVLMLNDPFLRPLAQEPRFTALLKAVHFM